MLSFGDIKVVEAPATVHEDLFYKDFNNSIDQSRLNKVVEDEGVTSIFPNCNRRG